MINQCCHLTLELLHFNVARERFTSKRVNSIDTLLAFLARIRQTLVNFYKQQQIVRVLWVFEMNLLVNLIVFMQVCLIDVSES